MARNKAPAFQFYPDAWLSSLDIALMTPAEEGAYIRLLAIEWLEPDCGLPNDDKLLAKLSRLGRRWHRVSGKKLRQKFRAEGDRLYNDRLLEERRKQLEWREKSSRGGKRSAAVRAQAKGNGGSTLVEGCLQPDGNTSFSSSSSIPPKAPQGGQLSTWRTHFDEFHRIHPNKASRAEALQAYEQVIVNARAPRGRKFLGASMREEGLTTFEKRHKRLMESTKARIETTFKQAAEKGLGIKRETTYLRSGEWIELPTTPQASFKRSWE